MSTKEQNSKPQTDKKKIYKEKRTLHRLTEDEKKIIAEIYQQYEKPTCFQIMKERLNLPSLRTAKEHCMKYIVTNPSRPFTPEEDQLILDQVKLYGTKWTKISQFFTDKSDINIRNRYKQLRREQDKTGKTKRQRKKVNISVENSPPPPIEMPVKTQVEVKVVNDEHPDIFNDLMPPPFYTDSFADEDSFLHEKFQYAQQIDLYDEL